MRTLVPGSVRMLDPVVTKEKHGFDHATTEAYDMFQPHLKMHMVTVQVNDDDPYEFLLGKDNVIANE